MGLAINVVAVLLAFFATASAVPAQFPHGKTVVYKYYGDVKAGLIEPAPYASQFALEGIIHVKHDTSDETLKNAYYVSLTNVKTGMHNGVAAHYERTKILTPINDSAKIIQEPFLIVYDEIGRLQGVKISENEPGWSKNMKMAIASMLQLDLASMRIDEPAKPRSFVTKENTIHGDCWINYDVRVKDQHYTNELVVTKFSSPMNCTGFSVNSFDHVDKENCQAKLEEPVNVASRKVFEIEKQGEDIIIKKIVAHGGSNYFPWNARSEAHYVLTNTTLTLERIVPILEIDLPIIDFQDIPIIRDLTYRKPLTSYATNAAIDLTQGRRVIEQTTLVPKLKKMLGEAADYIEENHLEMKEPDWKHGQTINRILHAMSYMTVESLEKVYNDYQELETTRDITIKNIFLGMIPQVGTPAACLFTLNVIRKNKISNIKVIEMLAKLPLNIKLPTEELLTQMENLVKLDDTINLEVRKAGILCFSSMIYRTMKSMEKPEESKLLVRYLQDFFERVKNESTYEMRVIYLMAMRNIEFGKIHEILAPIIRGDMPISENPMHMRLFAIWAIEKSLSSDYRFAHDLLWPVMADSSLPVKLRIASYEILMNQAQTMSDVLKLYWFMVYERNEHLYNYHYTTIKGIANSVDPCVNELREMVRKIMRFTRIHETIHYSLSSAFTVDYKEEKYNHAQKIRSGIVVDELTGLPEVLQLEHIVTDGRKPVSNFALRIHVQGCDEIVTLLKHGQFTLPAGIKDIKVLNLLKQVADDHTITRNFHIDLVILLRGRVIMANHYNRQSLNKMYNDVKHYTDEQTNHQRDHSSVNYQGITYDYLYEKQVTSDMGLPVLMENRVPLLSSLRINCNLIPDKKSTMMKLEINAKAWRHGDYSISIYNPIADVWHSVRRATATDLSLPLKATIAYNSQTKNLKITLPRLPSDGTSIAGILTHAKDCVNVLDNDNEELKKSCPNCRTHEVVTDRETKMENMCYERNFDSKDIGLRYTVGLFNCENGVTTVKMSNEFYRIFMSERKKDWNNWFVNVIMSAPQMLKNILISASMGSYGSLMRIQPSIVHPTSHVDISIRGSIEDVDHTNPSFHLFSSEKYNIRGKMDAIAASTNESARSWDLNVNVDLNQGHLMNMAKIQLTRKTPGEKNLKICVDAQKSYSAVPMDPLKIGITKEETNSKLTIAAGYTNEDKCTRDDTLVTMIMKGELSDEQKKKFTKDMIDGGCTKDMKNPLYWNPKNIVPKTLNCMNEAMLHTTMRKYTINVTHKKVPQEITTKLQQFEDILRTYLLSNIRYNFEHVETGNIKLNLVYSLENNEIDVSVVTPGRSYDLVDVNFEKSRFNGFGPVVRPVWSFPLDTTRFGIPYLYKYTHHMMKMCSIYPETVLTGDGSNIPFVIDEQWTLISGDYQQNFAIFVKKIDSNVGVKIFMKDRNVEILPNSDNNVGVMIDGEIVERLENGILVPADTKSWILKVTKYNDHTIVQMKEIPMTIVHGINHVTIAIDAQLQGKIGGLCGHLDGKYVNKIPKSYKMSIADP